MDVLDRAFQQDLGFKYSSLLAVFSILFQWARFNQIELNPSYQTTRADMVNILLKNNTNLVNEEVEKIIDFLILNPNKIRKLLGTDSECFDVPISDHNKRDHRYNIRPLIEISNNNIIWELRQHIEQAQYGLPILQMDIFLPSLNGATFHMRLVR